MMAPTTDISIADGWNCPCGAPENAHDRNPPAIEPTTPNAIVMNNDIGWRPGISSRAIAPATNPNTAHEMIAPIVLIAIPLNVLGLAR